MFDVREIEIEAMTESELLDELWLDEIEDSYIFNLSSSEGEI
jgi:hypothetical protein